MDKISHELKLRFDPRTIEHLGIKMYSRLPYALAELVANAYDAGAENVVIKLDDSDQYNKKIVVIDDGEGMSYEEINERFLVIGRKRREYDEARSNSKGRKITGKKGLGKLALFGIGKTIQIETTKFGEENKTRFIMDWDSILGETSGEYSPETYTIKKSDVEEQGTTIILSNLSRKTGFDQQATAVALSKLFNCYEEDFKVQVEASGSQAIVLTKELKYENITREFEWIVEDIVDEISLEYKQKDLLKGKIVSSKKPMKPDLRGITLYANGRLANVPSFFNVSEAGHTFSYLSGWIEADFLDESDEDLISTDRQSISWDEPEAVELQEALQKIIKHLVKDWSKKRKQAKEILQTERAGISVEEWYEKVPDELRPKLQTVVSAISDKPEIDDESFSKVVKQMHDLIPPYTYFHYRLLHEEIQKTAKEYYERQDYYHAFEEATKRYKNAVKDKSGVNASEDLDIMNKSFGAKGKPLKVTANYVNRPNGQPFSEQTLNNIEEGQASLSRGAVQGGRNVVIHEEKEDLVATGLFTEKDCLDMLGLLSHLFKRLEESSVNGTEGEINK